MTATTAKGRENSVRKAAARQGLRLVVSARRDPRASDFGRYWLVEADGAVVSRGVIHAGVIVGGGRHGFASLDEVEAWLRGEQR
jgi:hypothetical protein